VPEKVIVVSGANRGIGLELCRQYAKRGEKVTALCRKSSRELDAANVRIEAGIDVTSDAAANDLAKRLQDVTVDVLVLNAGILERMTLDELDFDVAQKSFDVNALGPLRLTKALLPRMRAGGKIALITSRMGSIADNSSGGSYAYRMSKAALNMAGMSLARDLKGKGIAVAILHPGHVKTDMTGGHGNIDAAGAASQLIARIDGLSLDNSGTFWHANGEVLPW
jgi:NAD(P)-dependent dehydrogenase (short-subunit alcohol dehydrogenase family)